MESKKSMKTSLRGGGGANSLALRPAWRAAAFAFVSVCAAAWTAAADALSLAINGTTATVSAEAGALDSTSKLYLVWDVADNGEVLSSWPEDNRLEYEGMFDGSAATCEFDISSIPVGSAVRAISTVGIKLIDGYVEQPQGTYFDTGVKDNTAYGMEIQLQPVTTVAWGAFVGSAWEKFGIGYQGSTNNKFYSRFGGNKDKDGVYKNNMEVQTMMTQMHTVLIKPRTMTIDGTSSYTFGDGPGGDCLSTIGATVLLGASWNKAGNALDGDHLTGSKWYGARFFDSSGNDIANFVPAVFKGTAILYDTVSRKTIGAQTIGAQGSGAATASYSTVKQTIDIASPAVFTGKTAYWTGLGVNKTNVDDPDNWNCVDASGTKIPGTYPDLQTKVVIQGETDFNIPAGQTLACHSLDIRDCSLKADCDWSGLANINAYNTLDVLQYVDVPTTVYIDTGFKPNQNTRVVMDVTVLGTLESWFGVSDDTSGNWWHTKVFGVSNDGGGVYSGYGNQGGTCALAVPNGRHTVELDKNVLKIDGVKHEKTNWSAATFQLANNLWLFMDNKGGVAQNVKNGTRRFHSCKIYDDGTLVRDFVPVKKPDGTVCLFDRENRAVYENSGTGSFTASAGTTGEKVYYSGTVEGTIDGTVNLAGHALTLANFAGSGTITDTSATGGELRVAPGEDEKPIENAELTLAGSLKLVKNGKGTFVATKTGQTYAGGTLIADGVLKCNAYGGHFPLGAENSTITIPKDGTLEMNGQGSYHLYSFVLDGGVMQNSGTDANEGNAAWAKVSLTADSTIRINAKYGFIGAGYGATSLDLGGHTLKVSIANGKNFLLWGTTIRDGTFYVVSGGYIQTRGGKTVTATDNVTMKLNCAFRMVGPMDVENYESLYTDGWNREGGKMRVYGTFTPTTDYFWGCEMQDGSTIDLSGKSGTWSTRNLTGSSMAGVRDVTFATGKTTIKIDPAAAWVKTLAKSNGLLVDWSASTSKPGDGVEFKLDAGGDTRYKIKRSADDKGLVLYLTPGFAVIVR